MGIIPDGGQMKQNRYWISSIAININIHETTTIEDIFMHIYKRGEQDGIEEGKHQRSKEFKELLNNER